MHRAEKSSSRICRNREVERAQELHRKKLDGVKSCLVAVTRPPAVVKPLALFRRQPRPPHTSNPRGDGDRNADEHCTDDENNDDAYEDEEDGGMLTTSTLSRASMSSVDDHDAGNTETQCSDNSTTASMQQPHHSLAKLDDFRSVAPVALDPSTHRRRLVHLHHQPPGKAPPPPPAGRKKQSLHGAFRLRRLKEIRADNVGLLERIKKSTAHYRNDALQRDWAQNVSYLASICEFPVALESLIAAPSPRHPPVQPRSFGGAFSNPRGRMDTPELLQPSIHQQPQQPVVVHSIRAVPTSPRRLQLNLSPAFQSLRKGMPQQPALSPITNTANSSTHGSTSCLKALSAHGGADNGVSSMTDFGFHSSGPDNNNDDDGDNGKHGGAFMDSDMLGLPGSPFIGDLGCSSSRLLHVDASASSFALEDATKYRLLKLGRFVGGSYLVLTVFCGDGVTNPYGFDVLAVHQESNREFTLRVTKAMTHELLETVSSSSQAAVTAVAAGTNWSMEDIARSICDHINFTTFEGSMGEMAFLVSNIGGKHDKALLLDSASATLAFCIHQCVELATTSSSSSDLAAAISENGRSTARKRRLHVFASTRLAKSYGTTCVTDTAFETTSRQHVDDSDLAICFQMHEDTAKKQRSGAPTTATGDLEAEITIHELYEIVKKTMSIDGISLERIVVAAVHHLHIVRVPCCGENATTADDDHEDTFKEVLIVNHRINKLLVPIPSPVASTAKQKKTLKPKTSRGEHLLSRGATSSSLSSLRTGDGIPLLESGMIWRHAYLLVRVWLVEPNDNRDNDGDNLEDEEDNSVLSSRTLLPKKKPPEFIQDTDGTLVFHVFNPLTKSYSERSFSPEQVDLMVEKLAALTPSEGNDRCSANSQETNPFIKLVLARLQLDVDLFGVEALTFSGLDVKTERGSPTQSLARRAPRTHCGRQDEITNADKLLPYTHGAENTAEKRRDAAAAVIQAHVRGYLFRRQCYDDVDYKGDNEDHDDEEYADEALDLSTKMQFQNNRCSVPDGNDAPENDESEHHLHEEHEPSDLKSEPLATLPLRSSRRLKQRQKIGSAFCIVQLPRTSSENESNDPHGQKAVVFQLGALGQLTSMAHQR